MEGVVSVNRAVLKLSILFLAPIAILALAQPASAQLPGPGSDIPDLNGVWSWGSCVGPAAAGRGGRGGRGGGFSCMLLAQDDPRLTDRARAFQAAFDEISAPKYDCAPMTIPHMFTDPYEYQLEQLEDRVIITYEKDDVVRTVWLEGHGHPEPAVNQFFVQGYSTGRYEGGTLIVTTDRFTFDPTGLNSDFGTPSSSQKRVTERYSRDGDGLMLQVTTEDTFFLREPWVFQVRSRPVDHELSLPWDCDLEAARETLQLFPSKYPEDPPIERIDQ